MADTIDKLSVSCSTCPYFIPGDDKGGTCHADPPQTFILPNGTFGVNGAPNMGLRSVWRGVGNDEWCGRHPMFDARTREPLDRRLAAPAEGTS